MGGREGIKEAKKRGGGRERGSREGREEVLEGLEEGGKTINWSKGADHKVSQFTRRTLSFILMKMKSIVSPLDRRVLHLTTD
jgi:hypothetical protein